MTLVGGGQVAGEVGEVGETMLVVDTSDGLGRRERTVAYDDIARVEVDKAAPARSGTLIIVTLAAAGLVWSVAHSLSGLN